MGSVADPATLASPQRQAVEEMRSRYKWSIRLVSGALLVAVLGVAVWWTLGRPAAATVALIGASITAMVTLIKLFLDLSYVPALSRLNTEYAAALGDAYEGERMQEQRTFDEQLRRTEREYNEIRERRHESIAIAVQLRRTLRYNFDVQLELLVAWAEAGWHLGFRQTWMEILDQLDAAEQCLVPAADLYPTIVSLCQTFRDLAERYDASSPVWDARPLELRGLNDLDNMGGPPRPDQVRMLDRFASASSLVQTRRRKLANEIRQLGREAIELRGWAQHVIQQTVTSSDADETYVIVESA